MKLKIVFSTYIRRDLKRAKKRKKDLSKFMNVVDMLANNTKLPDKYHDHSLSGNYKGFRECHVEPDCLLIYEIIDNELLLYLYRFGSHSDLF